MLKSAQTFVFIIFLIFATFLNTTSTFAEGTYFDIATDDSSDADIDAINFSQGRVWTIDKYGKYIWLTQKRSNSQHHWAFSNNLGTTWTQGTEGYNFLIRGSVAYDTINDKLHVIWTTGTCDSGGGIIYRRYGIARDGSNNITDINREDSSNINLQLDLTGDMDCNLPVALWVNDGSTNGKLVAIWSKSGSGLSQVRASSRALSLSAADGVAGNWVAPDGTGDSFSSAAPAVAADRIHTDTSGSTGVSAFVRGGTGSRKDDLYVFVQEKKSLSSDNLYAYRGIWSSGPKNWSGGWQSAINVADTDSSSGYSLKQELLSKPILDTQNDRIYLTYSHWKDGTNGDTVSLVYLNSSDSPSSAIDIYSSLGTHAYAPTSDIAYDSTQNLIYVTYIESTTNGTNGSINYKTYDGTTLSSATRFYTSPGGSAGANGGADIPILYESRSTNNRLLFAFRKNGALPPSALNPHSLFWGYIALPTPTPTPTPTSQSSFSIPQGPFPAPICGLASPATSPKRVLAKPAGRTSANIFFHSAEGFVTHYVLEYGIKPNEYIYSSTNIGNKFTNMYKVTHLKPNTKYYFRVRASNGCATGPWSQASSTRTYR